MIHGFSVTVKQRMRKIKQETRPKHFHIVKISSNSDSVEFSSAAIELQ